MKRYGQLYTQFASFPNLLKAAKKARSGAIRKHETQWFGFHLEPALIELQAELLSGSYQPQPYRYFKIYDPKERIISVAAFRDRVVHHALINILEPIYERCFIYDSYATRKDKGTHKAVARAQHYLQRADWFWKTDINKYFDSIHHQTLMALISRKIKDAALLELTSRIVNNGGEGSSLLSTSKCGLPIGNLTSQFFANVYLNGFDHYVTEKLKPHGYLRYMDDFVIFHKDKASLKSNRQDVENYLKEFLSLQLKASATFLNNSSNGLTFLGRRIFPGIIRMAWPNGKRLLRRMEHNIVNYELGFLAEERFLQSMNSYWAHLEPFVGLRRRYIEDKYHYRL